VVRLGNEVAQKGFVPEDDIEWMPFIQAYARAREADDLDKIRRLMKNSDPYITQQICQNVGEIAELASEVREVVRSFCSE
ncbi:MAG: hypothetical protein ABI621_08085, partial [Chloroflexota bacterium]